MRLYLAGPVTGIPGLNRPAFEAAARDLRVVCYSVEVPHLFVPPDAKWGEAMGLCLARLAGCDGIALLDGWRASPGACVEFEAARARDIPVGTVRDWLRARE